MRPHEQGHATARSHAPDAKASHGDEGLEQILCDPDIDLVVVVLPVQIALEAGASQQE